MKKELILIACMSTAPFLLNSAGRWADTVTSGTGQDTLNYPVQGSKSFIDYPLDGPEQYADLAECSLSTCIPDSVGRSGSGTRLSRVLLEREQVKVKARIRANWVLDTAASQQSCALVYLDKDNPALKAILFTDNAGNMLMRLEQEGRYQEMRVKKVEFHAAAGSRSRKRPFRKLSKSNVALNYKEHREAMSGTRKGAGYVPV